MTHLQCHPRFAEVSGVCWEPREGTGVISAATSSRAASPPLPSAATAGPYLDLPAGRMDTGSVCTSASDVLLEPRPLKNPPRDCLFSALL